MNIETAARRRDAPMGRHLENRPRSLCGNALKSSISASALDHRSADSGMAHVSFLREAPLVRAGQEGVGRFSQQVFHFGQPLVVAEADM